MAFNLPSQATLDSIATGPVLHNSVASSDELQAIDANMAATTGPLAGLNAVQRSQAYTALAWQCWHNGSSEAQSLKGSPPGCSRTYNDMILTIRKTCTLRQFCAAFARRCWNLSVKHSRPPAIAVKSGVDPRFVYMGADFSYGVLNPASLDQEVPLARRPTSDELSASSTNAFVSINNAEANKGKFTSVRAEVTGGRTGSTRTALALPPIP